MRYLVTGGAGFLGSHLIERLLGDGDEVICVDNLLTGRREHVEMFAGNPRYSFLEHNISLPLYVDKPVDVVMHLASPASPIDYLEHPIPTLKVGALGTHHTLGIAKLHRATYFLASTSEVYGDPQIHPQPEGYWGHVNPIGPRGVYDEAKRYAEAMTMAYHREHELDTRIVRIFNSILADEQVLYDDGTQLRRETIGELAARVGGQIDLEGYSVPAFDQDGAIRSSEASALVGHPPTGPCFVVRTRYGRSIRVTGDHSVFVQGPEGPPMARPVSQLSTSDKIAVAARIEVPERERSHISTIEAWEAGGRDPWDLMVVAPGLGAIAWEKRFDLFGAMAATGKWSGATKWRSAVWGMISGMRERNSVPLAGLRALGVPVPDEAWVLPRTAGRSTPLPAHIEITDELLWFLGLYVAEGCWQERPTKSAFITLSCEEETLDRAAKILQRDLALHVVRTPHTPQRSASMVVHSTLLLRVLEHLGFGAGRKRIPGWILGLPLSRLKWFLEGYREGDGVHSGKMAEAIRHEFSTTSDELKDDLIVALARFGLLPSVGRYESTDKPRSGEKRFPFWRLTLAHVAPWDMLEWDRGVEQVLQAVRTGDIVWAQVQAIEQVPATDLVYDFCVPGRENFWAGTGIMAHNTYGPRMRPTDGRAVSNFIVQALRNEPITVHGDGSQTRSFCYVSDLIEGFVRLVKSGEHQPVNIGNPEEYRVIDLARMIVEIAESKSEITFMQRPVDDPNVRRPDITRAREVLGWEPAVPVREGLRRTIEYFRTLDL